MPPPTSCKQGKTKIDGFPEYREGQFHGGFLKILPKTELDVKHELAILYLTPLPTRNVHWQAIPLVGYPPISGLDDGMSSLVRRIATKVKTSTFYDKIAGSVLVTTAVATYFRSHERRMADFTATFYAMRKEGFIIKFMHLLEGVQTIRENTCNWLFRQDFFPYTSCRTW